MAGIGKRAGKYLVRWYDLAGGRRVRTCPDHGTAKQLARDIEQALALGRDWQPEGPAGGGAPSVEDLIVAFVEHESGRLGPTTVDGLAYRLQTFARFCVETRRPTGAQFARLALQDYMAWLQREKGRNGPRSYVTAIRYTAAVERLWAWADEWQDEHPWKGSIPRARRISDRHKRPADVFRQHPTFDELKRCIRETEPGSWHRYLLGVLYYTGLRVNQAMGLYRADLDLEAKTLYVRPDLGKSRQERAGRVVPVAPGLLDLVRHLPATEGPHLLPCGRHVRAPRDRDITRAWARSGVREKVWTGRPHHCFRAGFVSGLRQKGAALDAIEFLVGHQVTRTAHAYLDPDALPMREAVGLVPTLPSSLWSDHAPAS